MAQPEHLPIEFRGYVAEDDIPELFQSTSVLVLPYDSATGSSGPAHQACEYGVPIVCADIPDFRGMVTDEGMAVRFYKVGTPRDLADQIIRILRSPELEHRMAEQNFTAGRSDDHDERDSELPPLVSSPSSEESGIRKEFVEWVAFSVEQRQSRKESGRQGGA